MPNFTFQDFLKAMIPLVAGGVSAYSRPAARAISGATSSLMAIQEDKRRSEELEQEMALRASEGERRGRVLSLQEQGAQGDLEDRTSKRKGQQGMFDALGQTIAQLMGAQGTPNPMNAGPVQPGAEERWQEAQDVGPGAIERIQSIMAKAGPEGAAAALEYLGSMQEGGRARREARGKEEREAGRETAKFEKTHARETAETANQAAYWKEMGAARTTEAAARKKVAGEAPAEKGGVDTDALAKVNKRIADLTEKGASPGAGGLTPGEMAELKALQLKAAALGGLNTPAGYLSYLGLGPQAGRP